jgi:eukaryotic-like serine/threonine-protein kinase
MLGMLKGLFKPKKGAPAKPKMRRVNLNRRFQELALTAQGSMSRVSRSLDKETHRSVCLKIQHVGKTAAAAARASQADRPPEGEIGMKVVHPHVVRTYEYGISSRGEHFVVMEFIDGVSLTYVRQSRVMTLAEKLELLAQAAEGLEAVHKAGFIHHDIGPKNFLVDRNNVVRLIDFGLAVPDTPAFHRPGNRTGTLQYMAPELMRREATDKRLDIFAFGVMAFEFLTNRLPYEAGGDNQMALMLQRINSDPLDPEKANPNLPAPLCDLLRSLIARRKEDRRKSMSGLAEQFREIAEQAG